MADKRVLIVAPFGYSNNQLDGQTIKVRSVYKLLFDHGVNVSYIDTKDLLHNWFLFFRLFGYLKKSGTVIFMPASRSLKPLCAFLIFFKKLFNYRILYIGIGGWLIDYIEGTSGYKAHPEVVPMLGKLYANLPELKKIAYTLVEKYKQTNVEYFPNFRFSGSLPISSHDSNDFRVVFLARVQIKKGIDTLMEFADYAKINSLRVSVDIYGQISPDDKEDIQLLLEKHKDIVSYKGYLEPSNIHDALSQYDVMAFPTHYYTEGIPGTVIDAYMSGLPVVATEWLHSHEIIENDKSGIIVPFENPTKHFIKALMSLYTDRNRLKQLKAGALEQREKYSEQSAWMTLSKYIQ